MPAGDNQDLIKALDAFINAAVLEVPESLMPGLVLAKKLADRVEELDAGLCTAIVGLAILLNIALSAAIRDLEQSIDRHAVSLKVQ